MDGSYIVIGFLFVLLFSCPFTQQEEEQPQQPEGTMLGDQWNNINQVSSEQHCLLQAKKVARDAGYSDALIFGCDCTGIEGDEEKNYDCTISAIDGSHKVTINCIKEQGGCTVKSDVEEKFYSFKQLQELIKDY